MKYYVVFSKEHAAQLFGKKSELVTLCEDVQPSQPVLLVTDPSPDAKDFGVVVRIDNDQQLQLNRTVGRVRVDRLR